MGLRPFLRASAMPSCTAFSAARWRCASIVSRSVGSERGSVRSSGPAMRPIESTRRCARRQAGIENRVVRRLDAGLADDCAGARVLVQRRVELLLADLAEQAEELAAERALRIAACRLLRNLEAGVGSGPLVEVAARDRSPDAAARRPARTASAPSTAGCVSRASRRARAPAPTACAAPRCRLPLRASRALSRLPSASTSATTTMWPVFPASGRPFASTMAPRGLGSVDRPERLLIRERRVLRAVQHLDRPRAQQENAERGADRVLRGRRRGRRIPSFGSTARPHASTAGSARRRGGSAGACPCASDWGSRWLRRVRLVVLGSAGERSRPQRDARGPV